MHARAVFTTTCLIVGTLTNPLPADVDVPISESEWQSLREGGLKTRSAQSSINQPITGVEWQALQQGGLSKREDAPASIFRRDKVMNCGHKVTGKGGSNGHGNWVPVDTFADQADTFCQSYTGTDIAKGHETSDTYSTTLTNQGDDTQPGPAGNIVFAIYNTERDGTYVVNHETCLRAMKAPLGSNVSKRDLDGRSNPLEKRDNCYGKDHKDYEGGYYKIDGIGAFGSEVYGV